ncbi:C4-dicarboxylate ABC transporter permease [candidate division KSB3 bacterium]|uniref:C4-dicarboxylate ABC transporter permease n=1 Tax=candidate division KSB3 bacterium TaxID=2044937 RepID=A0A2G6E309_9BACT|nr:MAG: C4-dicarboxylate ABC transporter permease [candidate division KSB3 bacterium]PIE28923.1 MAG: C4-dicarboxylate ABC transporter permease [candidate division KSB3 bacterium]
MIFILFGVFLLTLFSGFPIAFCLGLSSLSYVLFTDIPLAIIPQKIYAGIDVFVLLCIPGFILAGNLMNRGGITDRIIDFSNAVLGHIRGGLGLANVGASMIFAGISGTAVADTASIGAVMIPGMAKKGYEVDFSCAVTASSSTIGPIIPPSLPMIIAGTLTGLSVAKLFIAGAIPGILLGVGLMAVSYGISVKRQHPKGRRQSLRAIFQKFIGAFWALFMTVVILVGIVGGIFTPTEASVVAVLYAVFVGLFIYRDLNLREIPSILIETAVTSSSLMVLVGLANLFGWILTSEQIPQAIAEGMLSVTQNKYAILLLINLLLLFVGTFMETIAALIILFPVLLKVAVSVGVDPIHFAIIAVLNLMIGLTTPPVGVCLFVASSIGKIPLGKMSRAILPFLAVSLLVLLLVTYVPQFSLLLPQLVFSR